MREPNFPFAKYREWGPTPSSPPEIVAEDVFKLIQWQNELYKRPIFDDITGYYQFHPSVNGAAAYVRGAARNRPVVPENVESGDTLEAKNERHLTHLAKNPELATALFWAAASMREDVLGESLLSLAKTSEQTQALIDDSAAAYSADAIADYGYCLLHPVDYQYSRGDFGPGLQNKIESIAPGTAKAILDFGKVAYDQPDLLIGHDGVLLMEAAILEQKRRLAFWGARHSSLMDAFPDIPVSQELFNDVVDFPEVFDLHHKLPKH